MQNILACMKVWYILAESTKPKDMDNFNYESIGTKPVTLFLTAAQAALVDDRLEIDLDSGEDFVGPWFAEEAEQALGGWCKKSKQLRITQRLAQVLYEDVYYYTDFDDIPGSHLAMAHRLLDTLEAVTPDSVKDFHRRMRGA
jgi:hypothetical protein